MVNYEGDVKWIYIGCEIITSVNNLNPKDITVTTSGFIMITDADNHYIHVLNQTGGLVVYYQVNNLGIELPVSLSVNVSVFVWVGFDTWIESVPRRAKLNKIYSIQLIVSKII